MRFGPPPRMRIFFLPVSRLLSLHRWNKSRGCRLRIPRRRYPPAGIRAQCPVPGVPSGCFLPWFPGPGRSAYRKSPASWLPQIQLVQLVSRLGQVLHLCQEPGINLGKLLHFIQGKSVAERRLNPENAFCRGNSQFPRDFFWRKAPAGPSRQIPSPSVPFPGNARPFAGIP